MDNLEDFEARYDTNRLVFLQLYETFESLDKTYNLGPASRKFSIEEIEERFKALPDADKLKKEFRNNQDRYDYYILQISIVLKLFAELGPGKGEEAWAALMVAYRNRMEGVKNAEQES